VQRAVLAQGALAALGAPAPHGAAPRQYRAEIDCPAEEQPADREDGHAQANADVRDERDPGQDQDEPAAHGRENQDRQDLHAHRPAGALPLAVVDCRLDEAILIRKLLVSGLAHA
jgi:hypothetical protein